MKTIYKHKKIISVIHFILAFVFFYTFLNLFKINNIGFFITDGTEKDYYCQIVSIIIPLTALLLLFVSSVLKKIYSDKINDLEIERQENKILNIALISGYLSIVFFVLYVLNLNIESILKEKNISIIKSIVTDIRFYIIDMLMVLFFILVKRYSLYRIIKVILLTKIIFISFMYAMNLSMINFNNETIKDFSFDCNKNDVEVTSYIFVKSHNCNREVKKEKDVTTDTNIGEIIFTIRDPVISKKEKAFILRKFYDINVNYANKSWIELNKPAIYMKSSMLKHKNKMLSNLEKEKNIIDLILAGNDLELEKFKDSKNSLAALILRN